MPDIAATAWTYSIRRGKPGKATLSKSARICGTGCRPANRSALPPFSLPVRMWPFPGHAGSGTKGCFPCARRWNCSTPPSVSRNGLERPILLKTPSPRSRRIGESQTTPLIRAITRDIPAGKRISTPRKPAFGLAGDSRCLNPENGLPFRGVKCTCFPHPGSGPICAALRQRALPAPSLRSIPPGGACH